MKKTKPSLTARSTVLSLAEWQALWAQLEQHRSLPLGQYADACHRTKAEWLRKHPSLTSELISNGRYVVYLERVIKRQNISLPRTILMSVDYSQMQSDAFAFPLLCAQLAQLES